MVVIAHCEDSRWFAEECKKVWEGRGHTVILFPSPENNIANAIVAAHPDVIVTDFNMPVLDGLEVLSLLQDDERTRAIPRILYTLQNTADVRDQALAFGALFTAAKQEYSPEAFIVLLEAELSRLHHFPVAGKNGSIAV